MRAALPLIEECWRIASLGGGLLFFLALLVGRQFLLRIFVEGVLASAATDVIGLAFVRHLNLADAAGDDAFVSVGLLAKAAALKRQSDFRQVGERVFAFLALVIH